MKNNAIILMIGLGIALLRFLMMDTSLPDSFENNIGEKVRFVGVVVEEPSKRESNQHLVVKISDLPNDIRVLVGVPLYLEYEYGQKVEVIGVLKQAENFVTDTGKEFDYVNFLKKDKIHYLISKGEVKVISSGHGSVIQSKLFAFKKYFLEKVNYAISGSEATLLGGLILGERSAFSAEDKEAFIKTGTIHIVALSGYNVTIVANWILRMFAFAGHNLSFGFGILGIVFFVMMTGAPATAMRAGLMAILALIARHTGRTQEAGRGLLLAGLIMICINPMTLFYDISFQLSFIATFAVIYFPQKIEKYFTWVPKTFGLREVTTVTTAAYIFVLPFVLYKMGNLSIVALPTNFLVLPLIPMTMLFGFLTGFFGFFYSTLSLPFGFIAYLFLHLELSIMHFMAKLPFAAYTISNFPLGLVIISYVGFMYILFKKD